MGQSVFVIGGLDAATDYKFIKLALTAPTLDPNGQWFGDAPAWNWLNQKNQVSALGWAMKLESLLKQKDVISVQIRTKMTLDGGVIGGHTVHLRSPVNVGDEMQHSPSPGYSDDQPGVNRFYADVDFTRNLPDDFNDFAWFNLGSRFHPEGFNAQGVFTTFVMTSFDPASELVDGYKVFCGNYYQGNETVSYGWDIPGIESQNDIGDGLGGTIDGGTAPELTIILSDRQKSFTNRGLNQNFNGRFN